MVLFGSLTFSHNILISHSAKDVRCTCIHTYIYSKHLKTEINIYKECFEKGVVIYNIRRKRRQPEAQKTIFV